MPVINTLNVFLLVYLSLSSPGNTLMVVSTLTLKPGEDILGSASIDSTNGFAYFGTDTTPGRIVKIHLSDFTESQVLTLNSEEGYVYSALIDNSSGFAYFGTIHAGQSDAGTIVKVNLSNFDSISTLSLQPGEDPISGAIDVANGYAYFGTQPSGTIVRINLSNFTRAGSFTLGPDENIIVTANVDPINGFAYFGTINKNATDQPGKIVKVRLSDFTKASELSLNKGEQNALSVSLDEVHGFAYVATRIAAASGGYNAEIVKIRLRDFTRTDPLTLASSDNFGTSVIDTTRGFVYFGSDAGRIVLVRLADFSVVDSISLASISLSSAVIDPVSGLAYFGTTDSPGEVLKIQALSPPPPATTYTTTTITTTSGVTSTTSTSTTQVTNPVSIAYTETSTQVTQSTTLIALLANPPIEFGVFLLAVVAVASILIPRARSRLTRSVVCRSCGFVNPPFAKSFCVKCGKALRKE